MATSKRRYLPAAGFHWALPIYDPYVKLLGGDAMRGMVLEQMDLAPGQRVLDIGCATGTLLVLARQRHPDIAAFGLDPDPDALVRAARKAGRAGVRVGFTRGFSDQLPYADGCFDRISITGMFSLLPPAEKETTLREIRRVLKPGGSLHLFDVAKEPVGSSLWWPLLRLWLRQPGQRFHVCNEHETVALMREAGFTGARKTGQHPFWLWPLACYRAERGE